MKRIVSHENHPLLKLIVGHIMFVHIDAYVSIYTLYVLFCSCKRGRQDSVSRVILQQPPPLPFTCRQFAGGRSARLSASSLVSGLVLSTCRHRLSIPRSEMGPTFFQSRRGQPGEPKKNDSLGPATTFPGNFSGSTSQTSSGSP